MRRSGTSTSKEVWNVLVFVSENLRPISAGSMGILLGVFLLWLGVQVGSDSGERSVTYLAGVLDVAAAPKTGPWGRKFTVNATPREF
ncbi:MAG TPA: hypothetical protein VKU02_28665 [Gemmataceae bacterium]|nr:hypothetical protein [Gemmataceae bacterium]